MNAFAKPIMGGVPCTGPKIQHVIARGQGKSLNSRGHPRSARADLKDGTHSLRKYLEYPRSFLGEDGHRQFDGKVATALVRPRKLEDEINCIAGGWILRTHLETLDSNLLINGTLNRIVI